MRILVLDDDRSCSQFLTMLLEDEGYDVKTANSAGQAIEIAETFNPNALVADWLLKDDMDGLEVAQLLWKRDPNLEIIFTTGSPAEQLKAQLGELQKAKILEKPIEIEYLVERLKEMETR